MDSAGLIFLGVLGLANLAILFALLRRPAAVLDLEALRPQFDALVGESRRIEQALREELGRQREESGKGAAGLREEMAKGATAGFDQLLNRQAEAQRGLEEKLGAFRDTLHAQLDKIREAVEAKLADLQQKNDLKLEAMRKTVDEKLEGTLEKRLGQQFKLVSDRLEQVHKGLGEMQAMASSVGDLKRVLTNVKTRGTWGEIQLRVILEQTLTAGQFDANVAVNPASMERVEFAIRLPGRGEGTEVLWLPVDAKFPHEDYQRLVDAADRADSEGVAEAGKALELRLRGQAKTICDKYIVPPHTTDFALLFLPSEGLYAEVLRRPGLAESIQLQYRVVIAGPTTLTAILNSLQMGFRTLALEKRSSDVWRVLGAFKREFGKFGEALANVKKKLEQASSQIDSTEVRTRAVAKSLKGIESVSEQEAARLLPPDEGIEPEASRLSENMAEPPLFPPARP